MALTKVINDLADLNQSGSTNALKGCKGTTAQQPASSSSIEYLIVGGGGGNGTLTGGAGAGGLLTGTTTVYHGTPTVITVGEGGPAGPASYPDPLWARNGDDSGFNGIRAIGGGSGGSHGVSNNGIDGGSGGGSTSSNSLYSGGSGTTGQGMDGGDNSSSGTGYGAGGGGGAGNPAGYANGTGGDGTSSQGGTGGCGTNMNSFISSTNANLAQIGDVSGSDVFFAGGGGGGAQEGNTGGTPFGGPTYPAYANGGGGHGAADGNASQAGLRNTGGGAGGPGYKTSLIWGAGAEGGSGVGVLKYDNTIVTGYSLNSEDTYTVNWPADKYGIAYWPLNLDAKDVGGNYDGTATDITYTNGQFNQAASFNGSSSYIDTTFFVPPTSSLSSSVWFKTSSTAYRHYLFGDFNGGGSDLSARFSLNVNASNNFEVIFGDGSTSDTWNSISASSYLDGNWHNVVLTGNGTALKLYVDGSLIGTDTFLVPVGTAGAQSMVLGRPGGYNGVYWNGQLEQMRFYASELSLTDVQDIYNNSKPGSLPPLKTSSDLTTGSLSFPSGATTTALWDFNGDSVADPTTYDGVDTSMSYPAGKFGSCASFSGSGFIKPTQQPTLSGGFSYSAWIKFTGTGLMSLIGTGGTFGNYTAGLSFWVYNGKLYLSWGDGGSEDSMSPVPSTLINTGEWVHVVATTSGTSGSYTVKAYVNGILDGEDNSTQTIDTTTYAADFTIGAKNFNCPGSCATYYYYTGEMDQLRIYNTELTAQQVYDLWQKENDIQTHFSSTDPDDTTPTDTDILVFKEGSGEITFKNDSPPGAEVGMLRYNSTLGQMEHFNSGGWKDFTNCTTSICNYPTTSKALYQFNDNVNDTCGNYNGTEIGSPTYVTGKFGKAISLNGSTQAVTMPSILPTNSTASSSSTCWFKTTYAGTNMGTIFSAYDSYGGGTSGTPGWGLWTEGNQNFLRMASYYLFGSVVGTDGTANVSDGNWHFVAVVFDYSAGTLNCYLDGNSTPEISITGTSAASVDIWTANASIGYQLNPTPPYRYFNGEIDQVRIFPSALSQTQITELYNEVYCP